ncbi:hypothetical protein FOA52_008189 [Chlamydomonas sp. UWO 241]|nr:hypothetical protein FOA52_008189 [Chlamydomonas sp. UWO 241]
MRALSSCSSMAKAVHSAAAEAASSSLRCAASSGTSSSSTGLPGAGGPGARRSGMSMRSSRSIAAHAGIVDVAWAVLTAPPRAARAAGEWLKDLGNRDSIQHQAMLAAAVALVSVDCHAELFPFLQPELAQEAARMHVGYVSAASTSASVLGSLDEGELGQLVAAARQAAPVLNAAAEVDEGACEEEERGTVGRADA